MSRRAARERPQFVTGPQKCVVFGPVGDCRKAVKLFWGGDGADGADGADGEALGVEEGALGFAVDEERRAVVRDEKRRA